MNRYDWHPWFAWYPVRLHTGNYFYCEPREPTNYDGAGLVWLRWVECRIRGGVSPDGDLTEWWEYRTPQSALAAPKNSVERLLSDVGSYHPDCKTFNPPSHE